MNRCSFLCSIGVMFAGVILLPKKWLFELCENVGLGRGLPRIIDNTRLTIWVDGRKGNNNNDGLDFTRPKKTLSSAIAVASSGDVIMTVADESGAIIDKDGLMIIGINGNDSPEP